MKVVLLATSNSRLAGGLYYTISALSRGLHNNGIDISVISHNDKYSEKDKFIFDKVRIIPYHISQIPILRTLGYSTDIHRILNECRPIVIHQQGLWMYNSVAALHYKSKYPNTIKIIEPHGMLDPWAVKNSAWKKKIVGYLFEYKNLKTADCIHALCKSEYESIREFGLKNPVAIIPNGINIPPNTIFNRKHERKVLLFIGRIHPKKGIKELLLGLKILKERKSTFFQTWIVRVAGWSQVGHIDELKQIVVENHLENNVEFIGSIYGKTKEWELCSANAFILPSFSEGLPMSVLEAWAYKLPVIMTDFCNLPEGFNTNSAIHIEPTPNSISEGLERLCKMNYVELDLMGDNGYALVKEHFSWDYVSKQTIRLYNYLLNGGEKPEFVYE